LALAATTVAGPLEDGIAAYRRGDYATALSLLRPLADQGNATAQDGLGSLYEQGRGVARDDGQAVQWFRKAAEQGLATGENDLGFMYSQGRGVAKDDAQAVLWYRKAAEQGLAIGENNLGFMYREGRGVTRDDAAAVQWFSKAAAQGNARGQTNLGYMYEQGRGVPKDETQAVTWYRKAAEQGDAVGQNQLGVMYESGRGVGKDDAQAVLWYRKAAEQGNAYGENNLGRMYRDGRGVTRDDTAAVAWFRKGAEHGDGNGQSNLGSMYEAGRGIGKDDAQALLWYRKAAEQGNAYGENNLGRMFRDGRGVTRDDTAAVAWFRKSAERGNAYGQTNLGDMYEQGRGVPKDETEAVTWYRKGAEQGNAAAQTSLGLMYRDGRGISQDRNEAARWLRKAAEQGDAKAKTILASLEEQGRDRAELSGMVASPATASILPQCPTSATSAYEPAFTVLRADRSYDVHADGTYTYEGFQSICLNNDAGVKEHSQAPLSYNAALQDLEVLEAYTTTKDGKRVNVTADRIMLQQSPASADAPTFGDARLKTVIFPATEIGAVLTLRWRRIEKAALFPGNFSMGENFPRTYDIHASQVTLRAPESLNLHIEAIDLAGEELSSDKPGTKLWRWTVQNAVAHTPEVGATSVFDVSPRILVTTFADYDAAGKAYLDRARPKAAVTPAIQRLADEITAGFPDRRDQAEALYKWVSKNVRYVAIVLGSSGVIPHEAETIAQARYGDCKDHVTLLEALLAAKGIKSSPVLVNVGDVYSLPKVASFPGVFDHAITYLPEFDLFVDSTAGVAPFGVLPVEERGKLALVTDDGKGVPKIVTLPLTDVRHDSVLVDTQLSVNADGTITGSSKIVNAGVFDLFVRQVAMKVPKGTEPQLASNVLTLTGQSGTGTYTFGDPLDLSSAFTYSTQFTLPNQLRLPGPGALAVPVGLGSLSGIYIAFERMGLSQRDFPIAVLSGHREEVTVLTLPRLVKVTALPKPAVHDTAVGKYESSYTRKNNVITIKRILDVNLATPTVGSDDYQKLRALGIAVTQDLRAQILYQW